MDKKYCYDCIRNIECYAVTELKNLKQNETYKDKTGYECGVAFTNYEEIREFVYVIGEAINTQSEDVRNNIMKFIANKYNLPLYNVMLEFER